MKQVPYPTPSGYTSFCDDVRYEITGKVSLIGVYAGAMYVTTPYPVTLPKLALRISYNEMPGESTTPVQIRIYLPGNPDDEPFQTIDLPEIFRNPPPQPFPRPVGEPDTDRLAGMVFHIELTNIQLIKDGAIRVRAYRGEEKIKLGSLFVQSLNQEPTTDNQQTPSE